MASNRRIYTSRNPSLSFWVPVVQHLAMGNAANYEYSHRSRLCLPSSSTDFVSSFCSSENEIFSSSIMQNQLLQCKTVFKDKQIDVSPYGRVLRKYCNCWTLASCLYCTVPYQRYTVLRISLNGTLPYSNAANLKASIFAYIPLLVRCT